MRDWLTALHDELETGVPVVRVVVANVRGSAPREPGACMLVTPTRRGSSTCWGELKTLGTIGGGHLEFVATRSARDLLEGSSAQARLDRFSLGASLGQCCGGIVELWFQRYGADDLPFLAAALQARRRGEAAVIASTAVAASGAGQRMLTRAAAAREGASALDGPERNAIVLHTAAGPMLYERIVPRDTPLWLFGAGHVASALVHVLAPLPFSITWVDSREGKLPAKLPGNVRALHSPDPADEVRDMPRGDWALVMTHSHDEDFAICEALLRANGFGWAGVIGSLPKAARFRQRLARRGFPSQAIARLAIPIGIDGIHSKEAAAIAVGVAAQLLQLRESLAARANVPDGNSMTAARET